MFAEVARHELSLVIDMKTNSITRCLPSGKHTHQHTHREGERGATKCLHQLNSKQGHGRTIEISTQVLALSVSASLLLSPYLSPFLVLYLSVSALSFRHLLSAWQTAICCQLQLPSVWLRPFFIAASFSSLPLPLSLFLFCSSHISFLNSRYFARHSTVNILNHSLDLASLWRRAMLLDGQLPLNSYCISLC